METEKLKWPFNLMAYINNAVDLAIESGLVVQPEKEAIIWKRK